MTWDGRDPIAPPTRVVEATQDALAPPDPLADELALIDALPAYLTREEAATFLRIDKRTVDRRVAEGRLIRRRIDGRSLILRPSIRAYVLSGMSWADPEGRIGPPNNPNRKGPT